jgi:hypothetical protein
MMVNVNVMDIETLVDENDTPCGHAIIGAPTLSDITQIDDDLTILGSYESKEKVESVYLQILKSINESKTMYMMPDDTHKQGN